MLASLEAEAGGSLRITPETQPGVQVQHGQCEETTVKKEGCPSSGSEQKFKLYRVEYLVTETRKIINTILFL